MEEQKWTDVRCGNKGCGKLLFKVRGGIAEIETVCPRCKSMNRWPFMMVNTIPRQVRSVFESPAFSSAAPI